MSAPDKPGKESQVTVTADDLSKATAWAKQDPALFEAVFQDHWPKIYAILFRLVGNHAEAEDLALEAFWKLYRQPPRSGQGLGGWLYRVATNLGFNALRARKRRGRYEVEAGKVTLVANQGPDPAVEAEQSERRERVRRILSELKPRSAQLLVLRYSGLSYTELAAALGVAPTSIGSLLARAEREFAERYTARWGSNE